MLDDPTGPAAVMVETFERASVIPYPARFVGVPVMLDQGGAMAVLPTAVTRPFALTVNCGICVTEPNVPTFELTVFNVELTLPAMVVKSPVNAGICVAVKDPLMLEKLGCVQVPYPWGLRELIH